MQIFRSDQKNHTPDQFELLAYEPWKIVVVAFGLGAASMITLIALLMLLYLI